MSRETTQSLNAIATLKSIRADYVLTVLFWAEKQSNNMANWTPQDESDTLAAGLFFIGSRVDVSGDAKIS